MTLILITVALTVVACRILAAIASLHEIGK